MVHTHAPPKKALWPHTWHNVPVCPGQALHRPQTPAPKCTNFRPETAQNPPRTFGVSGRRWALQGTPSDVPQGSANSQPRGLVATKSQRRWAPGPTVCTQNHLVIFLAMGAQSPRPATGRTCFAPKPPRNFVGFAAVFGRNPAHKFGCCETKQKN